MSIAAALSDLYKLQARNPNEDYESQFEALYTEKNILKEKLARIQADANQTSAAQSRLDRIFTVVDGLKNRPLDWNEQIVRQMVECVKVLSKEVLGIRFRIGVEIEVRM